MGKMGMNLIRWGFVDKRGLEKRKEKKRKEKGERRGREREWRWWFTAFVVPPSLVYSSNFCVHKLQSRGIYRVQQVEWRVRTGRKRQTGSASNYRYDQLRKVLVPKDREVRHASTERLASSALLRWREIDTRRAGDGGGGGNGARSRNKRWCVGNGWIEKSTKTKYFFFKFKEEGGPNI